MNNAWESIRGNNKTSAKENVGYDVLKHNKPLFDDKCSKIIDQLQWLKNQSQINGDNPQNLRHETSRTFRNKKRV
jgi:hypothetical protein